MKLFAPLIHRFKKKVLLDPENLYGLTNGQIEKLRAMSKSDGWRVFMKVVDDHTNALGERMLFAPAQNVLEARGEIKGFRQAVTMIRDILTQKDLNDAKRRSEQAESTDRARRTRDAGTFSSFWDD